jgi:hypothetical protein
MRPWPNRAEPGTEISELFELYGTSLVNYPFFREDGLPRRLGLGEIKTVGQFMGASAAERPSFLELEDLHGRDDNLFDILAAIANQQWLRQRCNLASG